MRPVEQIEGFRPQAAVSGGVEKLQQMILGLGHLILLQQSLGLEQHGGLMQALAATGGGQDGGAACPWAGAICPFLQQGAGAQVAGGGILIGSGKLDLRACPH
jgi:hypothetical protein